jgi:hypothetical protein
MITLNTVAFAGFVCVCIALCFDTVCRWISIELRNKNKKKIICIDFDGVLHDNTKTVWKNARTIDGDAFEGSISWLRRLIYSLPHDYEIAIYSSRNAAFGGIYAMKKWLFLYGLNDGDVAHISFPLYKPPAHVTIDDRAVQFFGVYPEVKNIINFKPWNKR